jgi:23S rRNA pseudouridine1911/1915/1917 synthase
VQKLFDIIHEDADLLVLNKPAGLVCHPTKGDAYSSLISRVRLHLGAATTAHLVNRLDRETGGVVLVAIEQVLLDRLDVREPLSWFVALVAVIVLGGLFGTF